MKTVICTILPLLYALTGIAQGNHVFSGAELANFGVVDIPTAAGATWSTERAATPGYFSVVNTGAYTGCTDAANINGYIKKYGNTGFIFPVGSGSDLRTLEISAPANTTDAYATAWIPGDPSGSLDPTAPNAGAHSVFAVAAPVRAVSMLGQWDWQTGDAGNLGAGTTGTGEGLTITVSIPDLTSFASAANLRLVGWNGSSWIDLSGAATATGNTENSTLTGTMKAGITAVAVGSTSSTLAITLENFKATASNCDAVISWRAHNEVNADKYIIEQSADGISFVEVTTVKAKGGAGTNDYSYLITQPAALAYYRLKIIDQNGTFLYSEKIHCQTNCSVKEYMTVYPNPVVATGTVHLSFGTKYRGKALLYITNALGQRMLSLPLQIATETNIIPIPVGKFASGTYFISLAGMYGLPIGTVQKFIKQ